MELADAGPFSPVKLGCACWRRRHGGSRGVCLDGRVQRDTVQSAVDDLADRQLAVEAGAPQDDVDESAELTGLREQDTDVVIDKTDKADPLYARTISSFEDERLDLPAPLLKGLNEMRFVRPSKIQAASLPKIWAGRNLLAQSHNGTGKTACFVLGMLKVVSEEKTPQALCICPTRELAQQIATEVLLTDGTSTLALTLTRALTLILTLTPTSTPDFSPILSARCSRWGSTWCRRRACASSASCVRSGTTTIAEPEP